MDKMEGRDVFVGGLNTIEDVKSVFKDAFYLRDSQIFVEGEPLDDFLKSLEAVDTISIYALDNAGTFPFKVDMEFKHPIDFTRISEIARNMHLKIAYDASDKADDYRYYVASDVGTTIRRLAFTEIGDSYRCDLLM